MDDTSRDGTVSVQPSIPGGSSKKGAALFVLMLLSGVFSQGNPFLFIFLLPVLSIALLLFIAVYKVLSLVSIRLFKNRRAGNCFSVGVMAVCGLFWYYPPSELYEEYLQPSACIKVTHKTEITAHLEEAIQPDRNIIYCASFQKAWDKMRDDILKGDVLLASRPLTAQRLNKQLLRPEDLSKDAYVAEAGPWTTELQSRINRELQEKFGSEGDGYSISGPPDNRPRIMAYAFLYKKLEFPTKFEKIGHPLQFSDSVRQTPVKGFGVEDVSLDKELHQKLSAQVTVRYYKNDDEFVLSFTSKSPEDEIILAKVAPGSTLSETYRSVMAKANHPAAPPLTYGETLRVPKVDFDLNHHFKELEQQKILNKGWQNWHIERAEEDIKFKLDEAGAIVKSRVKIGMAMKEEAPAPLQQPRHFIFDKPFLICLKQKKGRLPYFCMWVSNPELLVKQ